MLQNAQYFRDTGLTVTEYWSKIALKKEKQKWLVEMQRKMENLL